MNAHYILGTRDSAVGDHGETPSLRRPGATYPASGLTLSQPLLPLCSFLLHPGLHVYRSQLSQLTPKPQIHSHGFQLFVLQDSDLMSGERQTFIRISRKFLRHSVRHPCTHRYVPTPTRPLESTPSRLPCLFFLAPSSPETREPEI